MQNLDEVAVVRNKDSLMGVGDNIVRIDAGNGSLIFEVDHHAVLIVK